ncbi:uncharacterized protein LOC131438464 [Malaya genurostris]|uniref:uncharacterized protein LOC131438464 n=1 Tax=Malaya genurostris TaxID=325434 RepID=UPI0026F3D1BD|nr:uncharacterized protein LOC131438464 [Malaya genurostris]
MPGSLNNISVLDRSPILDKIIHDNFLNGTYYLRNQRRDRGYLLANGIYPDWPILLKTISNPFSAKKQLFAKMQESARKDIECAFGILQQCWHILKTPCRIWDMPTINQIMKTCVILHNMRIEYRDNVDLDQPLVDASRYSEQSSVMPISGDCFTQYCSQRAKLRRFRVGNFTSGCNRTHLGASWKSTVTLQKISHKYSYSVI